MNFLKSIALSISTLSFWTFCLFIFSPLHWLIFKLVHANDLIKTAYNLDWSVFKFFFGLSNLSQLTTLEVDHMQDVRTIVWLLGLLSAGLIWFVKNQTRQIATYSAWLIAVVGLVSATSFTASFTTLHKIVFTNDSWLLDPSQHLLIQVYPENFFAWSWLIILLLSLISALALSRR